MELYEKQLASKQIFDGKVVKLFVDDIELPNGKGAFREVVRHPGAVCVIPITDEGEVIMVKQFRYPFSSVLLEIPAGKLEIGEDPLDAVKRELEEESGVVAENVEFIGMTYTTVAFTDEKIYTYMATGLSYTESHPDEDEFLEVVKIPLDTLVEMVMTGEIKDSKTQVAILKADRLLKERK
ncbi:MAG: NUDIX hydrolase [Ruminococcaceae bacterium]|nr:NUDIX hydrolase [Oscillospiraceae bacterium]